MPAFESFDIFRNQVHVSKRTTQNMDRSGGTPGVDLESYSSVNAELSEQHLLEKARALDEAALREVHDRYYGPLYQYVLYRVGDSQVAEDLTADVFLRLLDALRDRTAPRNTLRGWLYRVASYVVADYYRRRSRLQQVALHDQIPAGHDSPAEVLHTRSEWAQLRRSLGRLTELQREVIALRFGQELPIRDVAALLDKSEGAVKQLQARAIAALSRYLEAED